MSENKIEIPVNEEDLEDKRNEIAENIFIELDIVTKAYAENFGDDIIHNELEFVLSNLAFVLRSHENEHTLYNIDISGIVIPNSKFTNEDGEIVDRIYNLNSLDKITYFVNLLINSKVGIHELQNSKYFDNVNDEGLMMPITRVLGFIQNKIDEIILRMNVILNKL